MKNRTQTRPVKVQNLQIGHQNRVVIQSMTNSETRNVAETVRQCLELEKLGCEIIRFAVPTMEDAEAIREIKPQIHMPIVADIHFDYRLAIAAIKAGADAVRLNPGNIGPRENVEKVVQVCKEYGIPIRIGINSGSLEKPLLEKYGGVTPEAMIESAKGHIDILESMDFHDIVLSFKSSNVPLTIRAYRLASETWDYPLHLGVTEAGSFFASSVKSSAALGSLLADGIGDTIRISVSGTPYEEIRVAKRLLKCFGLIENVPELVSCPTCGRTQYDMLGILPEIEDYLDTVHADIKVAVMGCVVNGPGESKDADIGIAGGKNEAVLFRHGEIIRKIPENALVEELKKEIQNLIKKS